MKVNYLSIASEQVREDQHLGEQVQGVTNTNNTEFVRFPVGARGSGMVATTGFCLILGF